MTTTLATVPIVGVAMMDAHEARATLDHMAADLDQADLSIGSFRQRALDFAEREGWRALGYNGSAEAINAELGTQYSKSYLSRLVGAAKIERLLELPTGNSVPERVFREIGRLDDPVAQQAAWQDARAAAGGDVPSSAQARHAVDARRGDETPHDLRRAGVQLVRHGAWYQPTGFSGQINGWVGVAAPKADAVQAAWAEIKRRLNNAPNRAATPDLPPLNPPGWETLKAAGWRLSERLSGGHYRVHPPALPGGYGQAARELTADEIAQLAAEHRGNIELITALCAATGAQYVGTANSRFQIGWPPRPSGGGGEYNAAEAIWRLRELAGKQQPPAAAPALPPLPPLSDPLCYTWTRWRNDDGVIGMQHVSGYKISGSDAGDVEDVARQLSRPLAELHDHAWRVSYDASADGRADLHAYTATHEEFDAISASTIQRLALAAWWARQAEDDVPNMPDDVIDALWLAGYDWTGTAWVRGFERIDEDANLNGLRYQLGLTQDAPIPAVATPTPHLPDDWADAQRRANRLGLYLDMNMAGVFRLSNLSERVDHQIEAWADVLKLLDRKEAAAAVATVRGVGGSIPRIDVGALGTLGTRLTETSDPRELATLYRAIGMLLAAGGVLSALPTRPRAPRSADVSEQLAYLGKLEDYVAALEARLGVSSG